MSCNDKASPGTSNPPPAEGCARGVLCSFHLLRLSFTRTLSARVNLSSGSGILNSRFPCRSGADITVLRGTEAVLSPALQEKCSTKNNPQDNIERQEIE